MQLHVHNVITQPFSEPLILLPHCAWNSENDFVFTTNITHIWVNKDLQMKGMKYI